MGVAPQYWTQFLKLVTPNRYWKNGVLWSTMNYVIAAHSHHLCDLFSILFTKQRRVNFLVISIFCLKTLSQTSASQNLWFTYDGHTVFDCLLLHKWTTSFFLNKYQVSKITWTSPPQSNLRRVRRSSADKTSSELLGSHSPSMLSPFKTSLAEWHSARLGVSAYVSVCRCTLTAAKWLLGHNYSRAGVSPCCVCFVAFLHLNFSSTPIRSWTWLYHKEATPSQNSTIHSA